MPTSSKGAHGSAHKKNSSLIKRVQKRNGLFVSFDAERISSAIYKAMLASNEGEKKDADALAKKVSIKLNRMAARDKGFTPHVEKIQDMVEEELILGDFAKVAKAYILYRQKRAELRGQRGEVPQKVKELANESKKYFRNSLAEFVFYTTYSRWIQEERRRETWVETVARYVDFMKENMGDALSKKEYDEVYEYMVSMKALGSMRLLWSAGSAARATNVAAYNCSFIGPSKWRDFGEIAYVLMCGSGLGFSVERQNTELLPIIKKQTGKKLPTFVIPDSKEGWADAIVLGLTTWAGGKDVDFDYSKVRPQGSRLSTMGGRASGPEPLRNLLVFAREKMLSNQGRRLSPIDVHDIICKIGEVVVMGGVRRSALISLSDLDDVEMKEAKNGQFYISHPERSMANNSVAYNEKPSSEDFLEEWLNLVKGRSGERGIFNRGGLQNQVPARRWKVFKKDAHRAGLNPCVTGDTLVYVADGRGNIPIRQLAEDGKDVPVFTRSYKGQIAIRTMRNPRITGKKRAVYKITLDDGSSIKATANHKFLLRNGTYKEVRNLRHGESLSIITRFEASIKDMFSHAKERAQDYWWVNNGQANNAAEHRLIAAFHYNTDIPKRAIVHHRDRNAQNNVPENLEIMSKEAHDELHAALMRGDANPMRRAQIQWSKKRWDGYRKLHSINNAGEKNRRYSGVSDEELRGHALRLTRALGRRFSNIDWVAYAKKNGLPQSFSAWRQNHLGTVGGFAKWAARACGFLYIDADPRTQAAYNAYTKEGYDCDVVRGRLQINKKCEVCGTTFAVPAGRREYGMCSISCGLTKMWSDDNRRADIKNRINTAHLQRKKEVRVEQARMYSDLLFQLKRPPRKSEWVEACKEKLVSAEISRTSSPFRTYGELQEAATLVNHKVVSVAFVGYEDVYNGTVDEFHNFFVGGFVGRTRNGKKKFVYLNNLNCGEINLKSKQFCNLSEVVARPEDTEKTLMDKVRVATLLGTYQSTLTNFPYLSKEWKKNCEEERLLGVSITGQWDCPALRNENTMRKLREIAVATNKKYAKRFGVNESTAITCVKPSGNGSQLFDSSSGCHPRYAEYYIRRVRIEVHNPLFKLLKDIGAPYHPEVGQPADAATTFVVEFPIQAPKGAVTRHGQRALDQLQYWKMLKENYTEHNPSITVQVEDDEWVMVGNWVRENWDMVGGISFLPKSDHVYKLAPYEEITKEQYEQLTEHFPEIDFSKIVLYEYDDETTGSKELACVAGTCEVDIPLEVTTKASASDSESGITKES